MHIMGAANTPLNHRMKCGDYQTLTEKKKPGQFPVRASSF
jgi:hypothetical protein